MSLRYLVLGASDSTVVNNPEDGSSRGINTVLMPLQHSQVVFELVHGHWSCDLRARRLLYGEFMRVIQEE